jgi:protein-tyrosine phosphatase/rhodanese-related sulfurtransferase
MEVCTKELLNFDEDINFDGFNDVTVAEEINNRYVHGEYVLLDTRSPEEFAGCRVVGSFSCPKPSSLPAEEVITLEWLVANCIGSDQREVLLTLLHRKETKVVIGTISDKSVWARSLYQLFRQRSCENSSRTSRIVEGITVAADEQSMNGVSIEEVLTDDDVIIEADARRREAAEHDYVVKLLNLSLLFDISPILWSPQSQPFVSKYQYKPPTIIISEFLYLSSVHEALDPRICGPSGYLKVTHIVNATNKPRTNPFASSGVKYLNIAVNDTLKAELAVHFRNTYEFIEAARIAQGRKCRVLVHCAMGISRSTSLVIYYLMRARQMSLRDAYMHVRRQRPETFPNMAFMEQLIVAEKELFPDREPSVKKEEIGNLGGLVQDYNQMRTPSTVPPSSKSAKLQCAIDKRDIARCSMM